MTTVADRILERLAKAPAGLDDGQLAEALELRRQTVNQVCRRLSDNGRIHRGPGPSGRIVNRLLPQHDAYPKPTRAQPAVPAQTPAPRSGDSLGDSLGDESVAAESVPTQRVTPEPAAAPFVAGTVAKSGRRAVPAPRDGSDETVAARPEPKSPAKRPRAPRGKSASASAAGSSRQPPARSSAQPAVPGADQADAPDAPDVSALPAAAAADSVKASPVPVAEASLAPVTEASLAPVTEASPVPVAEASLASSEVTPAVVEVPSVAAGSTVERDQLSSTVTLLSTSASTTASTPGTNGAGPAEAAADFSRDDPANGDSGNSPVGGGQNEVFTEDGQVLVSAHPIASVSRRRWWRRFRTRHGG
ncbi:hypothetical protein [Frankia sp. Cj5]|uniref:hypothetical protein n=1 Tax=Frankia sp. Cj5 TaxID=2880978 RepID=UPI001EF40337|nr:hypothetical protein [Frankia sp. Cj5]